MSTTTNSRKDRKSAQSMRDAVMATADKYIPRDEPKTTGARDVAPEHGDDFVIHYDDPDVCPDAYRWVGRMLAARVGIHSNAVGFMLAWEARLDLAPVSMSQREIMKRTGIRAPHSLRRALDRLVAARLLRIEHTAGVGTTYHLRREVANV